MRVGLWSFAHLHAYSYLNVLLQREDLDGVLIGDEDASRGCQVAEAHKLPFLSAPEELLGQVDAVILTSANVDHRAMALMAAEAGVHALVEKPIATSVSAAQEMIAAFRRRGLILATAFPCPFSPAFEALQATVAGGELGRVLAVCSTNRGKMPGGFFIELERSGGGAVIDHTVHVADLLRRLLGGPPEKVYAEVGHGLFHQAWEDSGLLTLEWADGTFATLDCSWSRPESFPTWGDVTLHVVGEQGNADADLFGQRVMFYPDAVVPPRWQGWGTDLDALMIDDWIQAVREGRPPRSSGEDGLSALKVALAAYVSAARGAPVSLMELE
ncbi:MAG: Gfo/Idh/MocA family oxidoreductase [Chloroflexi bacterium]|nr:Gfo/Idh/MocA family oxidoreductase [Chloroflexota bacterium]